MLDVVQLYTINIMLRFCAVHRVVEMKPHLAVWHVVTNDTPDANISNDEDDADFPCIQVPSFQTKKYWNQL